MIVELTNNPIYVCNVEGRVDAIEFRARVGTIEVARGHFGAGSYWLEHLSEFAGIVDLTLCYLPMAPAGKGEQG